MFDIDRAIESESDRLLKISQTPEPIYCEECGREVEDEYFEYDNNIFCTSCWEDVMLPEIENLARRTL